MRAGVLMLAAATVFAATRPHYGGTLRVEVRESVETADPPQTGTGMADLNGAFAITLWEAGHRAVYAASDGAPGGRPFLDSIEIEMARPLPSQSIDLDLSRADLVQLDPNESRRAASGRKVWSSAPVRLLLLEFAPRIDDARVREAMALAVDRNAIHNVLLQRQGEVTAAVLPQWLSGYAFLFPSGSDLPRARALVAGVPPQGRALSLSVPDASQKRIADRIALNARDAGLMVSQVPAGTAADVRLVEVRIASSEPARALAGVAAALGFSVPGRMDSPESLLAAERAMVEGFRVIPLFHLPEVYGVNPRLKGGPGITPLGEWRFENLWVEGRP